MSVPLRASALIRHARRFIAGPATLESAAYKIDIIEPATTVSVSPAIYLPGQLDKIISSSKTSTLPFQLETATGLTANHAATRAYHIRDVTLFDGSLYSGRLRHVIADHGNVKTLNVKRIESAAMVSTLTGTRFFGHWLTDDCPTYLLAKDYAAPLCVSVPFADLPSYSHYYQQDWQFVDAARIKNLVVFQDFGQGLHRQKRYQILHDRLSAHFPKLEGSSLVYLRRGKTGVSRLVKNEEGILNEMIKRGFLIADIATEPLEEIIKKIMSARIVVSIEGSQAAHCCAALRSNTGMLMLSLPTIFNGVHRGWTEARNIRYGFVVGSPAEGGFTYSASEILLTVDAMLKALG